MSCREHSWSAHLFCTSPKCYVLAPMCERCLPNHEKGDDHVIIDTYFEQDNEPLLSLKQNRVQLLTAIKNYSDSFKKFDLFRITNNLQDKDIDDEIVNDHLAYITTVEEMIQILKQYKLINKDEAFQKEGPQESESDEQNLAPELKELKIKRKLLRDHEYPQLKKIMQNFCKLEKSRKQEELIIQDHFYSRYVSRIPIQQKQWYVCQSCYFPYENSWALTRHGKNSHNTDQLSRTKRLSSVKLVALQQLRTESMREDNWFVCQYQDCGCPYHQEEHLLEHNKQRHSVNHSQKNEIQLKIKAKVLQKFIRNTLYEEEQN